MSLAPKASLSPRLRAPVCSSCSTSLVRSTISSILASSTRGGSMGSNITACLIFKARAASGRLSGLPRAQGQVPGWPPAAARRFEELEGLGQRMMLQQGPCSVMAPVPSAPHPPRPLPSAPKSLPVHPSVAPQHHRSEVPNSLHPHTYGLNAKICSVLSASRLCVSCSSEVYFHIFKNCTSASWFFTSNFHMSCISGLTASSFVARRQSFKFKRFEPSGIQVFWTLPGRVDTLCKFYVFGLGSGFGYWLWSISRFVFAWARMALGLPNFMWIPLCLCLHSLNHVDLHISIDPIYPSIYIYIFLSISLCFPSCMPGRAYVPFGGKAHGPENSVSTYRNTMHVCQMACPCLRAGRPIGI